MCKRTPGGREPTSVFLVLFFDFIELTIHNKSWMDKYTIWFNVSWCKFKPIFEAIKMIKSMFILNLMWTANRVISCEGKPHILFSLTMPSLLFTRKNWTKLNQMSYKIVDAKKKCSHSEIVIPESSSQVRFICTAKFP